MDLISQEVLREIHTFGHITVLTLMTLCRQNWLVVECCYGRTFTPSVYIPPGEADSAILTAHNNSQQPLKNFRSGSAASLNYKRHSLLLFPKNQVYL